MTHFKFQKTLLAVSATAALAGLLGNAQAQAANDSGQLNFIGQISAVTCVLSLGDPASTTTGSKTVNLGTFTTASTSGIANGTVLGGGTSVTLSLKDSTGAANCNLGTTKWDIGVDMPANQISTTAVAGTTVLTNQAPTAVAASNVALRISSGVVKGGTGSIPAKVDFSVKTNAAYGTLLSRTTVPDLAAADSITVTAELLKSGTTAVTPGAFSASMPLLVWYK